MRLDALYLSGPAAPLSPGAICPAVLPGLPGDFCPAYYGVYGFPNFSPPHGALDGGHALRFLRSRHDAVLLPALLALSPGSPDFDATWLLVAGLFPGDFLLAQYLYACDNIYLPFTLALLAASGPDCGRRSLAFQSLIFALAIYHADPVLLAAAFSTVGDSALLSDEQCIDYVAAGMPRQSWLPGRAPDAERCIALARDGVFHRDLTRGPSLLDGSFPDLR